jgi:nucleoid DNA-binding protein
LDKVQFMNKTELVTAIARDADVTKQVAQRVLDSTIKSISDALSEKDTVSLVGFGSFQVRERAERQGRNPKTGEPMIIKSSNAPTFKAGKLLKEAVN